MKCPHCALEVHENFASCSITRHSSSFTALDSTNKLSYWVARSMECPACKKAIIKFGHAGTGAIPSSYQLIFPMSSSRRIPPVELPSDLAEDFVEAAAVLSLSPKASAALSRRCLQGALRQNGFQQKDLAQAIEAALKSKQLPSNLALSLDAVRNIGNFAAHPMKNTSTGEILPVEPEEAEWNLDVLEGLFDFFYVLPAREQEKIDALNAKLRIAGKPLLKQAES